MGVALVGAGYLLSASRQEPASPTPAAISPQRASLRQEPSTPASPAISPQRALLNTA